MNQEKTTTKHIEMEITNPSSKIENLDSGEQILPAAIPNGQLEEDVEAKTIVENKVSPESRYVKNFSIPKVIYDLAFVTVVLPAFLYFHTYLYKLGMFDFYGIPSDYIDVGYNDILALWSTPLVFLFIFLLPLYSLFIPRKVLEDLVEKDRRKKKEDKGETKWFINSVEIGSVILMLIVSGVILYNLREYWNFAASVYELIFLFIFTMFLYWLQAIWNTKNIRRQKLLKIGSVIFTTLLFLISTTGISRQLGKFDAERKTNYEKVCSPEKNWIRIGKSGDRIIAKEVNELTSNREKKTVLIGANCNDFIFLENTSFSPIQ